MRSPLVQERKHLGHLSDTRLEHHCAVGVGRHQRQEFVVTKGGRTHHIGSWAGFDEL